MRLCTRCDWILIGLWNRRMLICWGIASSVVIPWMNAHESCGTLSSLSWTCYCSSSYLLVKQIHYQPWRSCFLLFLTLSHKFISTQNSFTTASGSYHIQWRIGSILWIFTLFNATSYPNISNDQSATHPSNPSFCQ